MRNFGLTRGRLASGNFDDQPPATHGSYAPRDSFDPFEATFECGQLSEPRLDKAAMHFFLGFIGAVALGVVALYALVRAVGL